MSISFVAENHNLVNTSPMAQVQYPAGVLAGDLVLASLALVSVVDDAILNPAWASPVPLIRTSAVSHRFFYRIAGNADPQSWDFRLTNSLTWVVETAVYRGVDPLTPLDDAQATAIASTSAPSVTGVTFGADGGLAVLMAYADGSWGTHTPPAGFTARIVGDADERCDDKPLGSGATGAISWTESGGPSEGRACVFGLNPYVAPFIGVSGPTKLAPTVWQG